MLFKTKILVKNVISEYHFFIVIFHKKRDIKISKIKEIKYFQKIKKKIDKIFIQFKNTISFYNKNECLSKNHHHK